MKYYKIYDDIIRKALSENRKKGNGVYYERHHILPICLGGLNNKENLVLLTAKEHFICHKLLCEMYPTQNGIMLALHKMVYSKNKFQERDYKISSREFERLRISFSKYVSDNNKGRLKGERNPMFGKTHEGESLRKIKERVAKQIEDGEHMSGKSGEQNYMYGRKGELSPRFGKPSAMRGKTHKKETLKKMGENNAMNNPDYRKKVSERLKELNNKIVICPHCSKQGKPSGMKRWHFENCKYK